MTLIDVLGLLLALSVALNLGGVAAFLTTRAGTSLPFAILYGAGVTGGALGLYLAAAAAYR